MRKSPRIHASSLLPYQLPQGRTALTYLNFLPFICHFLSLVSGYHFHFIFSFCTLQSVALSSLFPGFQPSPAPLWCLCRFWTVWLFHWHLWLQTALSYLSRLCFCIASLPKHTTDTVSLIIADPGHPAQLSMFTTTILTVFESAGLMEPIYCM